MPATRKHRRKLTIGGRLFLWSLHEDDLNDLHVVAENKRLNLRYGWQHALPPDERYVDVMGPDFHGLPPNLAGWTRVRCPEWDDSSYVGSPRFVRKLVLWALQPKTEVVYKELPPGYSTHVVTGSPWGPGLPTFSSSPGEARTWGG
jgi:hypothetical protein